MVLTGFKPRPRLRTQAICCLLGVLVAFPPGGFARADLISVQGTLTASRQNPRDVMVAFVRRPDVITQLRALGVEERAAEERIAALSDDQLSTLAASLDSLPAGGQMYPGGGGGGSSSGSSYGLGNGGNFLPILLIVAAVVGFFWWLFRGEH